MNNIHESISNLAVDIETLHHLEGNPRKGDVSAIAAAYSQFGQVKPIVVWSDNDGKKIVIAGNHQLMAAKSLGWDKIACINFSGSYQQAIAYALADNRTVELGYTDDSLLNNMLLEVADIYPELWTDLGWDEFEIAHIDERSSRASSSADRNEKYIPPVIVNPPQVDEEEIKKELSSLVQTDNGESKIVAPQNVDHNEIATTGSVTAVPKTAPQAVVQYTIVFDSPDQQKRWYEFIRWLRNEVAIDGNTTAERLLNFIDEHCEI